MHRGLDVTSSPRMVSGATGSGLAGGLPTRIGVSPMPARAGRVFKGTARTSRLHGHRCSRQINRKKAASSVLSPNLASGWRRYRFSSVPEDATVPLPIHEGGCLAREVARETTCQSSPFPSLGSVRRSSVHAMGNAGPVGEYGATSCGESSSCGHRAPCGKTPRPEPSGVILAGDAPAWLCMPVDLRTVDLT